MKSKKIKSEIRKLNKRMSEVEELHEKCRLKGTLKDLERWLDGMPIQDLHDLRNVELGKKVRITKADMILKNKARKEFESLFEEKEILECKLREAKLEEMINAITQNTSIG